MIFQYGTEPLLIQRILIGFEAILQKLILIFQTVAGSTETSISNFMSLTSVSKTKRTNNLYYKLAHESLSMNQPIKIQ